MGRIGKLLSFIRVIRNDAKISDVEIDTGGGSNITGENYGSVGDDSFPLKTDFSISIDTPKSGGKAIIGYLDPINDPKALEGDKRIYGRDPTDGTTKVEIWLKNDGTALISNDEGSVTLSPDGSIKGVNGSGSFELQTAGDFVVNGVTIDTSGNITTPAKVDAGTVEAATSLMVNNKELDQHIHGSGFLIDSVTNAPITGVTGVIP